MTKQARTIIILIAALVAIAGAYIGTDIWQKRDTPTPEPVHVTPVVRLGNLDSAMLSRIETPSLILENHGGSWEVISIAGVTPAYSIELDPRLINSLAWQLASVRAESIVEEEPQDISIYGFDNPSSVRVIVTDADGKKAVYIRGDLTPSRLTYYVMEEGDTKVYTVSAQSARAFDFTHDQIRRKFLLGEIDLQTLSSFRLESQESNIEIVPKPAVVPAHLSTSFSQFIMNSPYKLPRGVDNEALHKNVLEHIKNLQIADFIDDNPVSLVPYGLDQPARIYINSKQQSLDLLVGNRFDDGYSRYAKLAAKPGVFTVAGLDPIVTIKPFALVDKIALLVSVNAVNRITVNGGPQPITAEVSGQDNDALFYFNGKQAEESSFRRWYQSVIGLLFDADIHGVSVQVSGTPITIEYELNTYSGAAVSISLIPYNRDFYAVMQEGITEFLISRNQVNRIWETANSMIYVE